MIWLVWFAGVLVTTGVLVLAVRWKPSWFRGEAAALRDPTIIFGAGAIWPLFWAGLFVGGMFFVGSVVIGWMLPKHEPLIHPPKKAATKTEPAQKTEDPAAATRFERLDDDQT
jgi:hypothetical protein